MRRRHHLLLVTAALAALAAMPAATMAQSPSTYRAGQSITLWSADKRSVARCTSSFPLRIGRRWVGITAGQCGQGMKGPIRVGRRLSDRAVIGRARSNGARRPWLAFRLSQGVRARQVVDRGRRPSLRVMGWVRTARLDAGMRICFTGGTSGPDRCGEITTRVRGLVCTDIAARPGDAGAPVYRDPGQRRRTRAVGILQVVRATGMCFTPIQAVLTRLDGARLRG